MSVPPDMFYSALVMICALEIVRVIIIFLLFFFKSTLGSKDPEG